MYGLQDNGCLTVQEFKQQYRILDFQLSDAMLRAYATSGEEYQTADGKRWKITQVMGYGGYEYQVCPVVSGSTVLCYNPAEFQVRYPNGIVRRTEEWYESESGSGPLFLTSDGITWMSIPLANGTYKLCKVADPYLMGILTGGGKESDIQAGCLTQQEFLARYGTNLLSVKGEPFATTGNNDYFFTPDGKLWVSITVAGTVGGLHEPYDVVTPLGVETYRTYKYCEVTDEAEKAEIFDIYGYQNGTNVKNVITNDIDCCDTCKSTEQIVEETWYLTQICTKPPCYPMNIEVKKIRCITPDDGQKYELDCDDIETAVKLINQQRGVQGMSGLRDCNCNSMMGLGEAKDVVSYQQPYQPVQPASNDYVLNKVCVPANHNGWLWLLGGTIAGFVLPKVFGKGK